MNSYNTLINLGKTLELPNLSTVKNFVSELPDVNFAKMNFAEKPLTEFSSPIPKTLLPNPSLDKTLPNLSTGDQLIASLPSDTSKLKFTEKPSISRGVGLGDLAPNQSKAIKLGKEQLKQIAEKKDMTLDQVKTWAKANQAEALALTGFTMLGTGFAAGQVL